MAIYYSTNNQDNQFCFIKQYNFLQQKFSQSAISLKQKEKMSMSRDEVQKKFNRANIKKQDFLNQIPRSLNEYLQFMDYKIRKQFKSFTLLSLCGGADRGNFIVDKNFQKAFLSMTLEQRTNYYSQYIESIHKAFNSIKKKQINLQNIKTQRDSQQITSKNIVIPLKVGKGSKSFQSAQIQIQEFIVKSKGKNSFSIDLRNYLLRKSKKKIDSCYVLQAIRYSDPETVRFAFLETEDQKKYLPIIIDIINESIYLNISKQILQINKKKTQGNNSNPYKLKDTRKVIEDVPLNLPTRSEVKKENLLNVQSNNNIPSSRKHDLNKSVIEDIVKQRDQQQLDEQLTQLINDQNQQIEKAEVQKKQSIGTPQFKSDKRFRNIFKIILPMYSLKEISRLHHYGSIYQSKVSTLYIYLNVLNHSQFKMQFTIDLPLQVVCKAISNVQLFKYWHPQIDEGQIKIKISSQNSCIVYQKTKAFSQWYKQRDYVLLTHMFRMNNSYFIIQKSVQNANFIPFQSITRGKFIYFVWKIEPELNLNKHRCKVSAQLKVNHQGLLNKNHQKQLTLRYLKGFQNMQSFYKDSQNQKKLTDLMGFQWNISDRQSYNQQQQIQGNMNSLRTCDFENGSQISEEKQQFYYSIQDLSEQEKDVLKQQEQQKSQHQISPNQIENKMNNSQIFGNKFDAQIIQTNKQGLIILPSKYLKKKHQVTPFDCEKKLMQFTYQSIVQKDDWIIEKAGGLKLINQAKIQAQNNVLKFIMKTLKKNLFSGKGILNISLPVQIFNVDSNLQRLCQSICLSCQFLQPVAKNGKSLQRFKRVLSLGLSCSIIYFDVEKPFNPILGQTYQGFIRGCPVYGQQISHHPPISSIYFLGRGYKITGNLQAKVHVHMNSGDGINQGFYHVIFDDGQQILFQTPPGQISGLAVGDRRFNIKDRGLYINTKNGLFCQMRMQASGGLFSRKKRQFNDQIQGQILRVKPQFIRKFMEADMQKKPSPSQSDIIQKLGQVTGRWTLFLKIDGDIYYDTRKNVPDRLIDDIYPLNSNSNYREDLFYRKKNDLSRSQIQKQRLQVFQRGDRKLRQKFHGKAH